MRETAALIAEWEDLLTRRPAFRESLGLYGTVLEAWRRWTPDGGRGGVRDLAGPPEPRNLPGAPAPARGVLRRGPPRLLRRLLGRRLVPLLRRGPVGWGLRRGRQRPGLLRSLRRAP